MRKNIDIDGMFLISESSAENIFSSSVTICFAVSFMWSTFESQVQYVNSI